MSPIKAQAMIMYITLISVNAEIKRAPPIRMYEKRPFGHFLYIETNAFITRARTPARIPIKAYFTALYSLNSLRTREISEIITKEGRTTPNVAQKAPKKPATLYPTKVAEFMAIGPGVLSAMAKISRISSPLSHLCLSQISFSIIGIIA